MPQGAGGEPQQADPPPDHTTPQGGGKQAPTTPRHATPQIGAGGGGVSAEPGAHIYIYIHSAVYLTIYLSI